MILQRLILPGLFSVIGTAILIGQEKGFAINYKESDASRVTSSSELYDPAKLTAAHNTIPFGTMVKVTRLDNGSSVVVKINDRGPFTPNRIVALSKAAAYTIGLKKYEKINVQLTILPKKEPTEPLVEKSEKKPDIPFYQPGSTITEPRETDDLPLRIDPVDGSRVIQNPVTERNIVSPTKIETLKPGLYQVQLNRLPKEGFAIQVGSFENISMMWSEVSKLHNAWFKQIMVQTVKTANGLILHKLLLGPFATKEKATSYKGNLKEKYGIEGFIVPLQEE
jgi:rare lipoprotein A